MTKGKGSTPRRSPKRSEGDNSELPNPKDQGPTTSRQPPATSHQQPECYNARALSASGLGPMIFCGGEFRCQIREILGLNPNLEVTVIARRAFCAEVISGMELEIASALRASQ